MHGKYAANMAMCEADLIIGCGARFDDRVTGKLSEFGKNAKIVHIDIDPSSISKIVKVDLPVVGDARMVMEELYKACDGKVDGAKFDPWIDTLERYDSIYPLGYEDSDAPLKPQWVIEETARIAEDDAIVVTDVGQHQMWVAQFYPFKHPRTLLTSGGLGTMGYGLPAAIGAKFAYPKRQVINFSGDGSILMNIQELQTAVEQGMPCVTIILNNRFLGMVRQWQRLFYQGRYSSTDLSNQPDFIKICEGFGAKGAVVRTKSEFSKALKTALKAKVPYFLDVQVDRFEDVVPMVPAGGALYNMILNTKKPEKGEKNGK